MQSGIGGSQPRLRPFLTGRRKVVLRASVLTLLPLILFATTVEAQTTVPSPVEPGRIEERFEERPEPRVEEVPVVPAPEEAPPPEEFEKIRFTLQGIEFEGMTVYAPEDLLPLYEGKLGTEVALTEVFRIANQVTARYRDDGYILSRAVVPQQEIRAGIVRIRILEGYVDNITIEGETHGSDDLIRSYAGKIQGSRPVHVSDFERYLLLINDLPGTQAQAVLQPAGHYRVAPGFEEHTNAPLGPPVPGGGDGLAHRRGMVGEVVHVGNACRFEEHFHAAPDTRE